MAVVGTIVANIVANTAPFEAGMKKAAAIHQSTVNQINASSKQMMQGYNNADDWWKGITSAQRAANSSYGKELEAALDKTRQTIANKAQATGKSITANVAAGAKGFDFSSVISGGKGVLALAGGFTAAATGALSLAAAYDELQKSNWIAKNAEQLAGLNRHMEKAVENIHKLGSNNELAGAVGGMLFGGSMSGISPRLRQALASGKQQRMSGGQSAAENEGIDKLVRMQAASLSPLEFVNDLYKKARPGESLGLLEEARIKQNEAIQKLGSAESFARFRTGFNDRYNAGATGDPAKLKAWDDAIEEHGKLVSEAGKPLRDFNKQIAELQVNTTDAVHSMVLEAAALKQSVINSAGGKNIFQIANEISAGGGQSLFGGGMGALKGLVQTITDPESRKRLLGSSLPAGEELRAELNRITEMEKRGQILGKDANLMRGAARNQLASRLGSGFNQTRLFGAMERGSAAAISAINEAQNRIKSPEEMTLEEMRKLEEEQLRELRKIGERTQVEFKPANWTK